MTQSVEIEMQQVVGRDFQEVLRVALDAAKGDSAVAFRYVRMVAARPEMLAVLEHHNGLAKRHRRLQAKRKASLEAAIRASEHAEEVGIEADESYDELVSSWKQIDAACRETESLRRRDAATGSIGVHSAAVPVQAQPNAVDNDLRNPMPCPEAAAIQETIASVTRIYPERDLDGSEDIESASEGSDDITADDLLAPDAELEVALPAPALPQLELVADPPIESQEEAPRLPSAAMMVAAEPAPSPKSRRAWAGFLGWFIMGGVGGKTAARILAIRSSARRFFAHLMLKGISLLLFGIDSRENRS